MRLLLVEDEKPLSNALVEILKHNNYTVDAVYNGKDAIDYIATGIYDVVILDIMLPVVNGYEVLEEVRKSKNNVPIILLTAKSDISDKLKGFDLGADDFLTKPFHSKELIARIKAITRRNKEFNSNLIEFEDLSLNQKTLELSSNNKTMMLTAKEYQVMEMLMTNKQTIISIESIMEKVWGFDSLTEINVVWTYISYLRKKLKLLNSHVYIQAIRNIGYRLEVKND